ncbi:MAG: hypothetical protein WC282_02595 [Bacilli bacterium]|jgi:hypothetical protein
MLKFLQVFGLGILYVVLSPFFLLILALFAVYATVMMVFLFFKMVILFFAGKNLFSDLPEDIEARNILEEQRKLKQAQAAPFQPFPFPPYGFPNAQTVFPNQPVIDQPVIKEIEATPLPEEKDEGHE